MAKAGYGHIKHHGVVRIEHGLYSRDSRMGAERLHGAKNHCLPADCTVLFWSAPASAKAAPGCDNDGGGAFRFCHTTQKMVIAMRRRPDHLRRAALITG
jgi:hypothetical protein